MPFLSLSSSGWRSKKAKRIQNKNDNIVYNYLKLPVMIPEDHSLPLQIGLGVSIKNYNTFLDHNESTGYKFHLDNGRVYIIDISYTDRAAVISLLQNYFNIPNGDLRFYNCPINVSGKPFHYDPSNITKKIYSDITICPDMAHVPIINLKHPGTPPGDLNGNPHGRIFCEVALFQSINLWNEKCKNWMHEQYVRCVFGIKLHDIRIVNEQVHQAMTARLWTRQLPASQESVPVTGLVGVSVQEWDFGTIQFDNNNPTGCTGPDNPAYQVNIPVSDVFWNPPIVAGLPNVTGYAVEVPSTVTANNFIIDLYRIQQIVIKSSPKIFKNN